SKCADIEITEIQAFDSAKQLEGFQTIPADKQSKAKNVTFDDGKETNENTSIECKETEQSLIIGQADKNLGEQIFQSKDHDVMSDVETHEHVDKSETFVSDVIISPFSFTVAMIVPNVEQKLEFFSVDGKMNLFSENDFQCEKSSNEINGKPSAEEIATANVEKNDSERKILNTYNKILENESNESSVSKRTQLNENVVDFFPSNVIEFKVPLENECISKIESGNVVENFQSELMVNNVIEFKVPCVESVLDLNNEEISTIASEEIEFLIDPSTKVVSACRENRTDSSEKRIDDATDKSEKLMAGIDTETRFSAINESLPNFKKMHEISDLSETPVDETLSFSEKQTFDSGNKVGVYSSVEKVQSTKSTEDEYSKSKTVKESDQIQSSNFVEQLIQTSLIVFKVNENAENDEKSVINEPKDRSSNAMRSPLTDVNSKIACDSIVDEAEAIFTKPGFFATNFREEMQKDMKMEGPLRGNKVLENQSSLEVEIGSGTSMETLSPDMERIRSEPITPTAVDSDTEARASRLRAHIDSIYIRQELTEVEYILPFPSSKANKNSSTAEGLVENPSATFTANAKVISKEENEKTSICTTTITTSHNTEPYSCSPLHKARTIPPKTVTLDHENDDSDKSPLTKPSPPELVDAETAEQELSPVIEYPAYLTPDVQVKVGVSPTEERMADSRLTGSESAISFGAESYEPEVFYSDNEVPVLQESETVFDSEQYALKDEKCDNAAEESLAFDNSAFEGAEIIDARDASEEGVKSPFEVSRENIYKDSLEAMHSERNKEEPEESPLSQSLDEDFFDKKTPEKDNVQVSKVMFSEERFNGDGTTKTTTSVKTTITITKKELINEPSEAFQQNSTSLIEFETESKNDEPESQEDKEQLEQEAAVLAYEIVGKVKEELLKRPIFKQESSEISDEDLVEVDDAFVHYCASKVDNLSDSDSAKKAFEELSEKLTPTEFKKEEKPLNGSSTQVKIGPSPVSDKERSGSTSGETPFQSCISDASKSPASSRPTSNEFDGTIVIGSGTEYETCATPQDGSTTYLTAASQDTSYATARSSLSAESRESSRESTVSGDSESSGHLGEASSEASETIVLGESRNVETPVIQEEEDEESPEDEGAKTPTNVGIREPYDNEIPESIIRSGVEVSFIGQSSWELIERTTSEESSSSPFEIITNQDVREFGQNNYSSIDTSDRRMFIEPQNFSIEGNDSDQRSLSESTATWRSSSVGTAINVGGQANGTNGGSMDQTSLHGSLIGTQEIRSSFSESSCSFENTTLVETNNQQSSTELANDVQLHFQSNGPVEVDFNPDYDVSEYSAPAATAIVNQNRSQSELPTTQGTPQEGSSEAPTSDTPLVSQSSIASSILSERTRQQLSYDLSPEVSNAAAETLTLRSDDLQQSERPESPVPPVDFADRVIGAQSSLGGAIGFSKEMTPVSDEQQWERSPCSDDADSCMIYTEGIHEFEDNSQHLELYTHQEEGEDNEEVKECDSNQNTRPVSIDIDIPRSKPIPMTARSSGGLTEEGSSTNSSLQEFERLEAEMMAKAGKRSYHGSSDSLGSYGSSKPMSAKGEKDNISVNSLTDFEKLEAECREAESIERAAKEEAARLSEIEEGHESQASDSQETLSDAGHPDSDSDDYERRMSEIDDILKQAQTNVEKMHGVTTTDKSNMLLVFSDQENSDHTDSTSADEKPQEEPKESRPTCAAQHIIARRGLSTESIESHGVSSVSTTNTDSLIARMAELDDAKCDDDGYNNELIVEEGTASSTGDRDVNESSSIERMNLGVSASETSTSDKK
ncbi:uncharacterized protein B4U79_00170, partial [Dinothrombium tinctorium]